MSHADHRDLERTPLFIVGYGRSGTTLLWNILNKNDAVRLETENHLIYNLLAAGFNLAARQSLTTLTEQLRATATKPVTARFLGAREPLDESLAACGPQTLKDCVEILLGDDGAATVWGEKSLSSTLAVQPISRLWPAAKFVHIVGDPRDVAFSYFEKKAWP